MDMEITIPATRLKMIEAGDCEAGTFFYRASPTHDLASLCVAALGVNGEKMFVALDGATPFRIHRMSNGVERQKVMPVGDGELCVRFDPGQAVGGDVYTLGALLIAPASSQINVQLDGMAGSSRMLGLRLSDWTLTHDAPDQFVRLLNWQFASRSVTGRETVLLSVLGNPTLSGGV
jgi:hypothetical protein